MVCFKQGGIPQRSVALLALGCPIGAMSEATFGLGVKVRLGRSQQRTAGGLVAWGLAFPLPESPKRSASDRARRGGGGAAWSFPFQQHCSGQLALYCVSGCLHFKQDLARRGRPPCVLLDALRWLSVKGGLTEPRLFSGAGLERKKLAVLKVWLFGLAVLGLALSPNALGCNGGGGWRYSAVLYHYSIRYPCVIPPVGASPPSAGHV